MGFHCIIMVNITKHLDCPTAINSALQKSCPGWKDAKSIVAMLRCCNYNQDDCITMYQTINDDGT